MGTKVRRGRRDMQGYNVLRTVSETSHLSSTDRQIEVAEHRGMQKEKRGMSKRKSEKRIQKER